MITPLDHAGFRVPPPQYYETPYSIDVSIHLEGLGSRKPDIPPDVHSLQLGLFHDLGFDTNGHATAAHG